jgi:hypothetical protein
VTVGGEGACGVTTRLQLERKTNINAMSAAHRRRRN